MFAVTCLLVSCRHTQIYAGTAEWVTGRQTDPSKQGVEHVTVQCITFRKYLCIQERDLDKTFPL